MGDMVIVAYRPRPGKQEALETLARDHVPHLRRLGLATGRPALIMRDKDGTIVEAFQWKEGAIATAHENPEILAMSEEYAAVCDYLPLSQLPEAQDLFATFVPLD